LRYYVTELSFPLGKGQILPQFLKNNKAVITLERNQDTGELYDDDLCAFRCLAYHYTKCVKRLAKKVKEYARQWEQKFGILKQGIELAQIPDFESLFEVSINIFILKEDGVIEHNYFQIKQKIQKCSKFEHVQQPFELHYKFRNVWQKI
jgi:hypothetical protein